MERAREVVRWIVESHAFTAVCIVGGFLIVAQVANFFLRRYIHQFVEDTENEFDDAALKIVDAPLVWTVRLIGLYLAISLIELPEAANFVAVALLVTVVIAIWTWVVFKIIGESTKFGKRKFDWLDDQSSPLVANLAKAIILAMAVYFFFLAWEIDLTAWLASAGIMGIAVGFAAKDVLSNLFGGLFILIDAPYQEGDYIHLDSGERGRVEHIGIRSTRIVTPTDIEITVPNAKVATAEIVNESSGPAKLERRISTTLGVPYGTDLGEVTRLLEEATETVAYVNQEEDADVHLIEFGEESILIRVACRLEDPRHEESCLDALNRAIYVALSGKELLGPAV